MKETQNTIIERKQEGTYETRGEWFDRMTRNMGKTVCMVVILLTIVAAVAHLASGLFTNMVLDFVAMVAASVALAYKEKLV